MNEYANSEPNDRRAKTLAYGLLVVAAMTFTFELGRQRGVIDGRNEQLEQQDRQVNATAQLIDELERRRASELASASPF